MVSGNNKEKKKYKIGAKIYSNKEFEFTIDAIKNTFTNITEETILASYKLEQPF
jgi:hypothetical protein